MHRNRASISLALLLLFAAIPQSSAQLLNKEAPVIVGHYHLNVTSVAEHKKFWVDTLGGTAIKFGPASRCRSSSPTSIFSCVCNSRPGRRVARRSITSASPCPTCRRRRRKVVANGYAVDRRARASARPDGEPANSRQLRPVRVPRRTGWRESRTRDERRERTRRRSCTTTCTSANKQYRRNAAVVHEGVQCDAASRPNRLLHRRGLPGVGYMLNSFSWEPSERSSRHQGSRRRSCRLRGEGSRRRSAPSSKRRGSSWPRLTARYLN